MERNKNTWSFKRFTMWVALLLMFMPCILTSCDSFDCTLNNTVECKLAFYTKGDTAYTITDTLSILDANTDSILLNKVTGVQQVGIPLSYYKDKDTLALIIWNAQYEHSDWIIISKSNTEHFESLDCPVKMFHSITDVSSLKNDFIDSVAIISPTVEYNNGQNIKIYVDSIN